MNEDFKPRVTLAVMAYNQSAFIDETVRSALRQQCEPLEIILSDDASPDDTFERMQTLAQAYNGPHRVTVRRNERNVGIGAHFSAVIGMASGLLIVVMAGDDVSSPDRAAKTIEVWDRSGQKLDLIACDLIDMDQEGVDHGTIHVDDLSQWPDVHAWAHRRPYIIGAGQAYTRRLFERFGPIRQGVGHEDQVITLRAICSGGAATLREPLVRYRRGGVSGRMRELSTLAYVRTMQQQNQEHLMLHEQWLADAQVANCRAIVQQAIRRENDRELFLSDLLGARTFAQRICALRPANSLGRWWRLRKLLYWQWPGLAVAAKRIQLGWKRWRYGDAKR